MNLAGWRFLVFAFCGCAAIVLLATMGVPGRSDVVVDRHTGKRVIIVRTLADALFEARATGSALAAHETLRARREQFGEEPAFERTLATLGAELNAPPSVHHPGAEAIAAENSRATQAREELQRRSLQRLPRESLLPLLSDLEADDTIAEATEALFAPLARWRQEHRLTPDRCDEVAVRALASLEAREGIDDPATYLSVADGYRSRGRTRARARWLLRAYGALPDSATVREPLIAVYVENGRLLEALALIGSGLAQTPDDFDLWRRRATLAGWFNLPRVEAEAREELLRESEDPELRERLIALCTQIGEPERAIPHARALALGSADPGVLSRPVNLALEAGNVDLALTLLQELVERAEDPRPWREWIVDAAWQDLRVERVVIELQALRRDYPEGPYTARLEGIFRRLGRKEDLVLLLEERLATVQGEPALELETEILQIHAGLGKNQEVRELYTRRLDRVPDARTFFRNLPSYQALELEGLPERARLWAEGPTVTEKNVGELLALLVPHAADTELRLVAVALAKRHPTHPDARTFLVRMADEALGPDGRLAAAEQLAMENPKDRGYVRIWVDRAAWAGVPDSERRARDALLALEPEDFVNLRQLADLCSLLNRPEEALAHWRVLSDREGLAGASTLRLIDALFAAGELEEAITVLEQRASLPGTTREDRLAVADQLVASLHFDRALRFYTTVIEGEPDHPHALLRIGQIRAWTNDPRGAIPFLERRLEVSTEEQAEVRFVLGEAYWASGDDDHARPVHVLALEELLSLPARTISQEVMVAKILTRIGRGDEARPIFERVIALEPDNLDLLLDYADAMISVRDLARARLLVDDGRQRSAGHARVMRLHGNLLLLEKRYADAAEALRVTIERHGTDAGIEAEMGRALELSGQWRPARDAYDRSLTLHPDNRDVAFSLDRMADQLAGLLHGVLEARRAGDDSLLEMWASGSLLLDDERTRIAATLGVGDYSGRAAAVGGGLVDVRETLLRLRLAAFRRLAENTVIAGGIEAAPGAPGNLAVGAWLGGRILDIDPFRSIGVRLHANLLLDEPAAAVGLGGRTTGLLVYGHHDFLRRFWAAAEVQVERISIDDSVGISGEDTRLRGALTLGWRVREAPFTVADRHAIVRPDEEGLVGPAIIRDPWEGVGPALALWIRFESLRLLGDPELPALLPIGDRFDYLTVGGRADFHLSAAWGAKLEVYAGVDMPSSESIFGLLAGVTHRPGAATELTAVVGYGRALGRTDQTDALQLRLGFSYRW